MGVCGHAYEDLVWNGTSWERKNIKCTVWWKKRAPAQVKKLNSVFKLDEQIEENPGAKWNKKVVTSDQDFTKLNFQFVKRN